MRIVIVEGIYISLSLYRSVPTQLDRKPCSVDIRALRLQPLRGAVEWNHKIL